MPDTSAADHLRWRTDPHTATRVAITAVGFYRIGWSPQGKRLSYNGVEIGRYATYNEAQSAAQTYEDQIAAQPPATSPVTVARDIVMVEIADILRERYANDEPHRTVGYRLGCVDTIDHIAKALRISRATYTGQVPE